ncbi:diguanylate cyclase [Geoalkalibacter sp.]|uniref:diguanylate cyclase n=1 Tax=Geoalkalibacter sp. TaxID=3041440 RepID=UPI00272ECAB8|nr:diguanylate cyclase [Geoalkalibacter sp.]
MNVAQAQRVLVVDDSRVVLAAMKHILGESGFTVTLAESVEQALEFFSAEPFPVVFSDIVMPGIGGLGLLREIKELAPATQVIMMTGHGSLDSAVMALRLGANDYLKKPFEDPSEVTELTRRAFDKIRQVEGTDQQIQLLRRQIEDLEQAKREFQELSIRDGLTGLYNHRYFKASLALELSRAKRHARQFSIVFIDIDHFKKFNDSHGHPAGDKLLGEIARLIQERVRVTDLAARYGGEEFTLILPETGKDNALLLAEKIRAFIQDHPFAGRESQPQGCISASLGVAAFPVDATDAAALLQAADQALYAAKNGGRNRVVAAGAAG